LYGDDFLSLDFGLKEFGIKNSEERLRRYGKYVYETGAVRHPDKPHGKIINETVITKERKKEYNTNRVDRFKYKTRYFSDSGIIGTKEFVSGNYKRFKHIFVSKKEKIPKPISGLSGIYSLEGLSES